MIAAAERIAPAGVSQSSECFSSPRAKPMNSTIFVPNRRLFLGTLGASFFLTPGLFAEELVRTASQTEGPFYPDKLPLDTDNDLLVINDGITPAVGEITHFTGKIMDAKGTPL